MNAGRRVRLTFEATVEPAGHCPDILRVLQDSGTVTYVDTSHSAGVTLEDVAPAREWTDGDLYVAANAYQRRGGRWHVTGSLRTYTDEHMTRAAEANPTGVLRYQAGEQ